VYHPVLRIKRAEQDGRARHPAPVPCVRQWPDREPKIQVSEFRVQFTPIDEKKTPSPNTEAPTHPPRFNRRVIFCHHPPTSTPLSNDCEIRNPAPTLPRLAVKRPCASSTGTTTASEPTILHWTHRSTPATNNLDTEHQMIGITLRRAARLFSLHLLASP
jgi:hypothetical protein